MQYHKTTFAMRDIRPGYTVTIALIIFEALGGGLKKTMNGLTKMLTKKN